MDIFHAIATAGHDRPVFTDPAFMADLDRGLQAVADGGVDIMAYVMMSAHFHMLLKVTGPACLGPAMQRVLGPPAWSLNRRAQQRGGIFTRTFWRVPVENDGYLWTLPLYINANPAPNSDDLRRLSVGPRSSHDAMMSGSFNTWLRPGVAFEQYSGDYAGAMQAFLDGRPKPTDVQRELTGPEECVIGAVARACGVSPRTLCSPDRGGKRDRMLLAWALAPEIGVSAASRLMGVNLSTARRWVAAAQQDHALAQLRRSLRPAG